VRLVHDRKGKGYVDEADVVKVDDRGIHIDVCEDSCDPFLSTVLPLTC
jgi:hypothetical protein